MGKVKYFFERLFSPLVFVICFVGIFFSPRLFGMLLLISSPYFIWHTLASYGPPGAIPVADEDFRKLQGTVLWSDLFLSIFSLVILNVLLLYLFRVRDWRFIILGIWYPFLLAIVSIPFMFYDSEKKEYRETSFWYFFFIFLLVDLAFIAPIIGVVNYPLH